MYPSICWQLMVATCALLFPLSSDSDSSSCLKCIREANRQVMPKMLSRETIAMAEMIREETPPPLPPSGSLVSSLVVGCESPQLLQVLFQKIGLARGSAGLFNGGTLSSRYACTISFNFSTNSGRELARLIRSQGSLKNEQKNHKYYKLLP